MKTLSVILLVSMITALVLPLTGPPHVCEHQRITTTTSDCCSATIDHSSTCSHQPIKHDHQHQCTYLCTCGCHVLAFEMQFFSFEPSAEFTVLDQELKASYNFEYFVSVWQPPRIG